jgi:hypothetical protein
VPSDLDDGRRFVGSEQAKPCGARIHRGMISRTWSPVTICARSSSVMGRSALGIMCPCIGPSRIHHTATCIAQVSRKTTLLSRAHKRVAASRKKSPAAGVAATFVGGPLRRPAGRPQRRLPIWTRGDRACHRIDTTTLI